MGIASWSLRKNNISKMKGDLRPNDLYVTIGGAPFDHLVNHFVLTYSNWATASICFSENFESLSGALQRALCREQTDRLTAVVQDVGRYEIFTPKLHDC